MAIKSNEQMISIQTMEVGIVKAYILGSSPLVMNRMIKKAATDRRTAAEDETGVALMAIAWSHPRGRRLAPMQLIFDDHGYGGRCDDMRMMKPRLRRRPLCTDWFKFSRVEHDRENRQRYPGRTGLWPVFKPGRKVRVPAIRKKRWLRHALALGTKGRYRRRYK